MRRFLVLEAKVAKSKLPKMKKFDDATDYQREVGALKKGKKTTLKFNKGGSVRGNRGC